MVECRIVDEWFVCRYACFLLFVICMYVGWMSGLLVKLTGKLVGLIVWLNVEWLVPERLIGCLISCLVT